MDLKIDEFYTHQSFGKMLAPNLIEMIQNLNQAKCLHRMVVQSARRVPKRR